MDPRDVAAARSPRPVLQRPVNSNPDAVTIALATSTRIETDDNAAIQTGDRVEIEATTGTDPPTLVAVVIQVDQ